MTYLGKKVDIVFCNDACASIRFLDGALDSNVERQKAYFVIVEGLMKREVVVQIPDKLIDTASIRVVVLAAACGEAWEGTQDKYFGTRFVSDLLGHCLEKLDEAINVTVTDRYKASIVSIVEIDNLVKDLASIAAGCDARYK